MNQHQKTYSFCFYLARIKFFCLDLAPHTHTCTNNREEVFHITQLPHTCYSSLKRGGVMLCHTLRAMRSLSRLWPIRMVLSEKRLSNTAWTSVSVVSTSVRSASFKPLNLWEKHMPKNDPGATFAKNDHGETFAKNDHGETCAKMIMEKHLPNIIMEKHMQNRITKKHTPKKMIKEKPMPKMILEKHICQILSWGKMSHKWSWRNRIQN